MPVIVTSYRKDEASVANVTCVPQLSERDILFVTNGFPESLLNDSAKLPRSTGERKVLQAVAHGAVAGGFNVLQARAQPSLQLCSVVTFGVQGLTSVDTACDSYTPRAGEHARCLRRVHVPAAADLRRTHRARVEDQRRHH
eukprot:699301-Prymnesium_polylepis.1